MSRLISEETIAFVKGVAAEARRVETPCGDGHMVWHVWGEGPPLALLHGGYGSWTHWIRNVLPLSRSFTVAAPDLPGLGELADATRAAHRGGIGQHRRRRTRACVSEFAGLHIAGFSFGGVLGGHVAAQLGDRVRAFTIVGSNGLGLVRQPTELRRLPEGASEAEALAVARHNLAALMIADPAKSTNLRSTSRRRTHRAAASRAGGSRARTRSPARYRSSRRASTGFGASATPPPTPISMIAPAHCAMSNQAPGSRSFRERGIGSNTKQPIGSTRFWRTSPVGAARPEESNHDPK